MQILFFGSYDPACPRTRVLERGLRQNGVEVRHCNAGPRRLPVAYAELSRRFDPRVHVVLVRHPGHHFVPLTRGLAGARKIPVVFDALVSPAIRLSWTARSSARILSERRTSR